ncbi:histamine N-methyltransferase-like [Diadema antillarum]|uniref:histamine N-methyltransferase-like n=1 Tax=Diadema antillarum TaxID=105358 RepID=UPI003A83FB0C
MAALTFLTEDLDYYAKAHQTFLQYATKVGPVGNWSEEAFGRTVAADISARCSQTSQLRILGIGSGAGDVDRAMTKMLLPHFPKISNTVVEPSIKQLYRFKKLVEEETSSLQGVSFDWKNATIDDYVGCLSADTRENFHLIHVVHAIYYTSDLTKTLQVLYDSLAEGGILFVVATPEKSVFVKMPKVVANGEQQLSHSDTLSDNDVTKALDMLNVPYTIERGSWLVPCTPCFDESSPDGQLLLDFYTHVKHFRKSASSELLHKVLQLLRSSEVSVEKGGDILNYRHWVHIIVRKEQQAENKTSTKEQ